MKNTAARVGPAGVQGAAGCPRERRRALAPEHDASPSLMALNRLLCGAPPLERVRALMQRRGTRTGTPLRDPRNPQKTRAAVATGEPNGRDMEPRQTNAPARVFLGGKRGKGKTPAGIFITPDDRDARIFAPGTYRGQAFVG